MKKLIYTLSTFVVLALGAVSCDSYFDVELQDQSTLEEMFSKSASVRKLAAHMYAYLPKEENPVDGTSEGGFSGRTDARQINASSYVNNCFDLRVGNYSPASVTGYKLWENYYKAIAHCTLVIDNIHLDVEDNDMVRAYVEAEARFMRAYYYFLLFRTYGPVIVWGDKAASSEVKGETLDRNTLDENINFIVSELDKAIEVLPVKLSEVLAEAQNMGRPTKGAAMALKSRVLLYAASPLFNGNQLYAGMTNYYGEEIFPSSYDENKWRLAKEAAKAVIELNEYELVGAGTEATGDKFVDGVRAYQNIFFENWNKETIWGWWMNFTTDWLGRTGTFVAACAPRGMSLEGWQSLTPSFKLVDAYAMYETGRYPVTGYDRISGMDDYSKPIIDTESGYEAEGFSMTTQFEAEWAGEFEAHNSTLGREPRYYACLVPNGYYWPCDPVKKVGLENPKNGGKKEWRVKDMKCDFWRGSGSHCERHDGTWNNFFGYSWRRLYKANNPLDISTDYTSMHYVFPAFRLAEIYFNYAECCIELGEYAEAIKYINMIRNRSGLNNLEEAYPGIAGDPELLKWCMRHEKMIEFAIEGPMHFYDNTRWMTAEQNFPALNWTLNLNDATDYHDSWVRSSEDFPLEKYAKFTKRDYLFPMDSDQLAEMTNYTQNYGF